MAATGLNLPRNSSHRARSLLKPFSRVYSRHFVNGDSRCGPLLVPALLRPVAIAEDVLAEVLPALEPIVGPSNTAVAIEGAGPDLTI